TLHLMKQDYDAAIASADRALAISTSARGERQSMVVQTYNVLGMAVLRKGDPDRALGYLEKARDLQSSLAEKDNRDAAVIFSSLAEAYRAKHDYARAARIFREAFEIDHRIYGARHPDVSEDLVNLGD